MAAVYPTAVKSFSQRQNYTQIVDAGDVNQAYDEVTALQTTLGIMPQSDLIDGQTKSWPTVKDRISAVRKGVSNPMVRVTASDFKVPYNKVIHPSFTSKQVDTHGMWTTSNAITCQRTGWYTVTAYARWHKDDATSIAKLPTYDRSGKVEIAFAPPNSTGMHGGQTTYYPNGWRDFNRDTCSIFMYWVKGTPLQLYVLQKVQTKGTFWATAWFTAVYHRDPATTNNL